MLPEPHDPHDLARFFAAQEATYAQALAELRTGRKQSHWIWYVLPQLLGLGSSIMSRRYGITSLAEAQAYLAHPVLGARLLECVAALNAQAGMSASDIMGEVDARKFHSCLTLFAAAAGPRSVFGDGLSKYFADKADAATLALLDRPPQAPGER